MPKNIDNELTEEELTLIAELTTVVEETEAVEVKKKTSNWLFWVGSFVGIFLVVVLILGFFVVKAVINNAEVDRLMRQEVTNSSTESTQKTEKADEAESKSNAPTLDFAKTIVENFLLAFEDSDSKRMSNLLVGDAYNKFSGELDAIPYDHDVTEGKEFEKGLFIFKVTTYFKGDDKGPYLEDWEYRVAKTDEGYLKINERKFKTWTYFTPEM